MYVCMYVYASIYPEKTFINSKRHMYPNAHCSTTYNNQDMEAT